MKTLIKYIAVCSLILWLGCSGDNEHLTATTTPEFKYEVPQGNHNYDDKIVDWHKRCGFYILYKFEPKDVYFNGGSSWTEAYMYNTVDEKYLGDFSVKEADENYVGEQLSMVENMFLNFYPDSLLKKYMCISLFLGRELNKVSGGNLSPIPYRKVYYGLAVSHGDETIETLSTPVKTTLKAELNDWFLGRLHRGVTVASEEFFSVTTYDWATDLTKVPPTNQCYSLGIVYRRNFIGIETIKEYDYKDYVNMITKNSYETLTTEPANGNYSTANYTGILHPKKDVNGLIRQKYDFIVRDYLAIGIDLQAIGNYQP